MEQFGMTEADVLALAMSGPAKDFSIPDEPALNVFANPASAVPPGDARLVIITCGGPFDTATRSYLDNVVAFAVPSGGDHSLRVKNTG